VLNTRPRIEDVVQPLHRRSAPLQQIDDPAERDHRPGESPKIEDELNQLSSGNASLDNLASTKPEDDDDGQADDELHERVEDAGHPIELVVLLDEVEVQTPKISDLLSLLGK